MNIGFIGLGKLGMPCAEVLAEKHRVFGYDIAPRYSERVEILSSLEALCAQAGLLFIALPTPHDKGYDGSQPTAQLPAKDFDYSALKACLTELNSYCSEQKTVVLISTVLPGTVRRELDPLLDKVTLIYNPYLIAMGTVQWDMVNPEMIIIGTKNGSEAEVQLLRDIYDPLMQNNPRYVCGTWEEAESVKIFYNTFISAKIGIVNMIQDVAERLGNMNVDVVCDALKHSTQRITGPSYMKPGMGDGGPCHPRDNIALRSLSHRLGLGYDLFGAIVDSRDIQARNMAEKLAAFGLPVLILGASYKPGVPYTDGSYALLVAYYLQQKNIAVYFDQHPEDKVQRFTYLLSHEHVFNDFPFRSGSVIVDPWRSFRSTDSSLRVIPYGNTRNS